MSKIEAAAKVGQGVRVLRDDELDAVSGAKAGGDKVKYMEIKLVEIQISSYQP